MFGLTGIIAGLVLVILGAILALVLPGPDRYQGDDFTTVFIFTGIIMVIIGIIMIFW
jgi:hypothetical protein